MPARFFELSAQDQGGFVKVKCVCLLCGFTIIGNASEGLNEQQREHLKAKHPAEAEEVGA